MHAFRQCQVSGGIEVREAAKVRATVKFNRVWFF